MELGHVFGKAEILEYATGDLLPATNAPGERFSYSGTNYIILGLIIEAVTGRTAEAEIRSRILEPLGLKNTFMESFEKIPGGVVNNYHYATPQFQRDAGIHRSFSEIRPYLIETTSANLSAEWTAGGIVSTASDLVRWGQELRDGRLVSAKTHRAQLTYYPPRVPYAGNPYLQGVGRAENYFRGSARFRAVLAGRNRRRGSAAGERRPDAHRSGESRRRLVPSRRVATGSDEIPGPVGTALKVSFARPLVAAEAIP
jgi:CubicO group peptidase (beta-lactamase class C family)